MDLPEILYSWLAQIGILLGLLGCAASLLRGRPSWGRAAGYLAWGYGAAIVVAWALRYRLAGHLPLFGTYESALSLALTLMLVAIAWELVARRELPLAPMAALLSGVLLLHGDAYDPTPYALTISERSWVVDVHSWVAWMAFAVLAINAILAARLLLRTHEGDDEGDRGLLFSLELGFFLHTAMLASGSFYKFLLFGSAWSFDPIETLGFVAWMAYGTLLHLHFFARWRGRRLGAWCVALFVLLVISYRGIVYFPAWSTYHIFDMDLRLHVTGAESATGGGGP